MNQKMNKQYYFSTKLKQELYFRDRNLFSNWLSTNFLKAIRGVQSKNLCQAYLKRSSWGGTEAFYGMSKFSRVQKLFHFEVCGFGRIPYKKIQKIWNLEYFTQNVSDANLHQTLLLHVWQFCLKICTNVPLKSA